MEELHKEQCVAVLFFGDRTYSCASCSLPVLSLLLTIQGWERAKIGLASVDDNCWVDLGPLSKPPLEVTMDAMNHGRDEKNRGKREARD